ncbi:insulinase family protein [Oxalobacteraceae bacterium]|nr:insulinase family protein [Oxalobacteraceae bacterium]
MTLQLLRLACGTALLASSLLAPGVAQGIANAADELRLDQVLPIGPQVKVGKLANGLTYYIQRNAKPEKKLELRLVVKAGSILEDDDQQGLAHFTEHMAFNGSTHFKRSELTSYLQSIGVKFGADLNAYTSFDETVYVLPIPTDAKGNVERGFQVLEDWAHGLSFNDADIDSERGIVLEELRLGKGAEDRMNKVLLPKLLNGSRYAQRLPIGQEQILKSFSYDAIKRFYRDWYRPNLMAVVVVGDVDPAQAQRLIESHFSALKNPQHERPRTYASIPERSASEAVVVTDREANGNSLFIRYPIQARPVTNTLGEYRRNLVDGMYSAMLGQRMAELTQQANPPFIQGGSSMGKVVRGYRSFSAGAVLGKGGALPAIDALIQEDQRARQFGFTASELERAKKTLVRSMERAYAERDKTDSSAYVGEYIRNFLEQESIPGIENESRYVNTLVPGITLDEVNAAVREAIPFGQNKLVVYRGSDKPELPVPSTSELLAAVEKAEQASVKAREEKKFATQLMARPLVSGGIVSEKSNAALGTTELTLSNGVKVVLKPTAFRNDQVLMGSTRWGGQSLAADADILNARYASAIVGQMGVLDYTPIDLQNILAGKSANAGATIGGLSESVTGSAGSADVETMLQLAYLEMTQPRKDGALFSAFIGRQREASKNILSRPEAVFSDTIVATLFGGNPRVPRVPRQQDFDQLQLDRIFELYRSRLSSARGFTFFLVGSFEVDKIKPLLATYLGTLPVAELPVAYRDLGVRPVRGVVKKEVKMGTEAKSTISITFSGAAEYSEGEAMRVQALIETLNIRLIEVLREKLGLIYGGGISGSLTRHPYGSYSLNISLPCGPENVDKVIAAAFAEIDDVKLAGVKVDDLDKVKANWSKNYRRALSENSFWLAGLQSALVNGSDPATLLTYEERANAITPEQLKETAKRYFDMQNYVQVVLNPEKVEAAVK